MNSFKLIFTVLALLFIKIFSIYGQAVKETGSPEILSRDVIREVPAPGMKCMDVTIDSIYLWVPDNASRSIVRLKSVDGSNTFTEPFPEGTLFIEGITCDGKNIWLCGWETIDGSGSKIFKMDRKNGQIIGSFEYPGAYDGNWPHGLTYAGSFIWANNMKTHTLDKIDPNTGELLATLPAPTEHSTGIAFYNKAFWTSDPTTGLIYKQDQYSGEVLGSMEMPVANCNGMEWEGESLWTVSWSEQKIYKLDVGELFIEEPLKGIVSVYPNPSRGRIRVSSKEPIVSISIINETGRTIKTYSLNGLVESTGLHLEVLPQGTYFIKTELERGSCLERIILLK
jgi:glutamine cyclotransferase